MIFWWFDSPYLTILNLDRYKKRAFSRKTECPCESCYIWSFFLQLQLLKKKWAASATHWTTGVAGFEPTHEGVKVPCLTAWLYPNNYKGERWESNPRVPEPQSGALTTSPRSPWCYLVSNKKLRWNNVILALYTGGRGRTGTPVRALDFESLIQNNLKIQTYYLKGF